MLISHYYLIYRHQFFLIVKIEARILFYTVYYSNHVHSIEQLLENTIPLDSLYSIYHSLYSKIYTNYCRGLLVELLCSQSEKESEFISQLFTQINSEFDAYESKSKEYLAMNSTSQSNELLSSHIEFYSDLFSTETIDYFVSNKYNLLYSIIIIYLYQTYNLVLYESKNEKKELLTQSLQQLLSHLFYDPSKYESLIESLFSFYRKTFIYYLALSDINIYPGMHIYLFADL